MTTIHLVIRDNYCYEGKDQDVLAAFNWALDAYSYKEEMEKEEADFLKEEEIPTSRGDKFFIKSIELQ